MLEFSHPKLQHWFQEVREFQVRIKAGVTSYHTLECGKGRVVSRSMYQLAENSVWPHSCANDLYLTVVDQNLSKDDISRAELMIYEYENLRAAPLRWDSSYLRDDLTTQAEYLHRFGIFDQLVQLLEYSDQQLKLWRDLVGVTILELSVAETVLDYVVPSSMFELDAPLLPAEDLTGLSSQMVLDAYAREHPDGHVLREHQTLVRSDQTLIAEAIIRDTDTLIDLALSTYKRGPVYVLPEHFKLLFGPYHQGVVVPNFTEDLLSEILALAGPDVTLSRAYELTQLL